MSLPRHMTRKQRLFAKHRMQGMSLVEVMITSALGLFTIGAVGSAFVSSLASNADMLKSTRLEEELASVMFLIAEDVRRSGYTPETLEHVGEPWANPFSPVTINADTDCILYQYEDPAMGSNGDGAIDANEQFGFRFNNNAIEMGTGGADCDNGTWIQITEADVLQIVDFTLDMNDTCRNVSNAAGTCGTAASGDLTVTVRELDIALSAQLTDDAQIARTLTETIRIRNDLVTVTP